MGKSNGNSFGIGNGCPTEMIGLVQFDGERRHYEDFASSLMGVFQPGAF